MSTREERRRVARALEERGLLPPLHRQLEIRAEATAVARRALRLRGAERERSERLEARYRQLAIRAREGLPVEWPE